MIDKATFEAHVRAEAERKYPRTQFNSASVKRNAYIAARMEHEWKLVEALQGTSSAIRDLLHSGMEYPETGERHESDPQAAADAQAQAEAALAALSELEAHSSGPRLTVDQIMEVVRKADKEWHDYYEEEFWSDLKDRLTKAAQ